MNIKKIIVLSLAVHIIAVLTAQAQIEIKTAAELAAIGKDKNSIKGSYILMNDLTLEEWTPIVFNGKLNGNGHTITLNIDSKEMADKMMKAGAVAVAAGLFREILVSGMVMNLHVTGNINFEGNHFIVAAGGVAGFNAGRIVNCISSVNVKGKGIDQPRKRIEISVSVGGNSATALFPYDGGTLVGGIAGINEGNITNCYSTGNIEVSGNGDKIGGGIAGGNGKNMIMGTNVLGDGIYNCYTTSAIHIHDDEYSRIAGGITGMNVSRLVSTVALNSRIDVSGKSENKRDIDKNNVANGLYGIKVFEDHSKSNNSYYQADMDINIEKSDDTKKQEKEKSDGNSVDLTDTKQQSWWNNTAKFTFGQNYEKPWIWDEEQQRPILYWEKLEATIPADPNNEDYTISDEPSKFEGTFKPKKGKNMLVFKGNQFELTAGIFLYKGTFINDETTISLFIKRVGPKQKKANLFEVIKYKFNDGILEITEIEGPRSTSPVPRNVIDIYYKN